jgi:hypothetical protein
MPFLVKIIDLFFIQQKTLPLKEVGFIQQKANNYLFS